MRASMSPTSSASRRRTARGTSARAGSCSPATAAFILPADGGSRSRSPNEPVPHLPPVVPPECGLRTAKGHNAKGCLSRLERALAEVSGEQEHARVGRPSGWRTKAFRILVLRQLRERLVVLVIRHGPVVPLDLPL